MNYFRFVTNHSTGIYEAVDQACPRQDPRRALKPDGSWLPKVGAKFPGAISFWNRAGLDRYLESGLQEWHRSVVTDPLIVVQSPTLENVAYEDEFQALCAPYQREAKSFPWERFAQSQLGIPTVEKVVAYVERPAGRGREILVFEHDEEFRDAGLQVPAGTVDPGEALESAVLRETEEESGLTGLSLPRKIDEYVLYRNTHRQFHRRHVFLLTAPYAARDRWTHRAGGSGADQGLNFHFSWLPLPEAEYRLAASLGCSARKA